ncbi:MAG: rod-binding protein [Oligoflexia bacterium]|nr:rod-binding protein [Oligoflexia bacterium]
MVSLTALFFFILTIDKSHAQDAAYYREMVAKNPQKYGSLWNAAQGMEMTFVREMIKGMRKTVQESPEMKNNQGFQIFRSMLDDQYAEITVQSQGIGLAEMIVKQVTEMEESERVKNSSVRVRELNKSDLIRK